VNLANDDVLVLWSLLLGGTLAAGLIASGEARLASRLMPANRVMPVLPDKPGALPRGWFVAVVLFVMVWGILAALKWTSLQFHWWPVVITVPLAAVVSYYGYCGWLFLTRGRRARAKADEDHQPDTSVPEVLASLQRDAEEELARDAAGIEEALRTGEAVWRAYNARVDRVFWRVARLPDVLTSIAAVVLLVVSFGWGPVPVNSVGSVVACLLWPLCALALAVNLYLWAFELITFGRMRGEGYLRVLPTQFGGMVLVVAILVLLVDDVPDVLFAILVAGLAIALVSTLSALTTRFSFWYRRVLRPDDAEPAFVGCWVVTYLACSRPDLAQSAARRNDAWWELAVLAGNAARLLPYAVESADRRMREYRKAVEINARGIAQAIRAHQRHLVLPDADELADLRRSLAHGLLHACARDWGKLKIPDSTPERRRWWRRSGPALLTAAAAAGVAVAVRFADGLVPAGDQTRFIVTLLLVAALSIASALGASTQGMQELTMRFAGTRR
jgi:hypothetical protein